MVMDVTAQESAPLFLHELWRLRKWLPQRGRESVSITGLPPVKPILAVQGDDACGQYDAAAEWHWNEGHAENKQLSDMERGRHTSM